jgi:hypothetical protein
MVNDIRARKTEARERSAHGLHAPRFIEALP